MKFLIKTLLLAGGIFLVSLLHLSAAYILPYPLNTVNVIFGVVVALILIRGSGVLVWLSFLAHLVVELYTITPFGITLFSATVSTLVTYWLYEIVFTNRSWYAAAVLSAFAVAMYRLLYVGLLLSLRFFSESFSGMSLMSVLPSYGLEIISTTVFVALCYGTLGRFFKRMDPKAINV